jgi:hypothetical protein
MDQLLNGPIEADPIAYYGDREMPEVCALLDDALAGIELGAYDKRIVEWLKGWDKPTIVTVASLVQRARGLG